jgi:hypothetical protein
MRIMTLMQALMQALSAYKRRLVVASNEGMTSGRLDSCMFVSSASVKDATFETASYERHWVTSTHGRLQIFTGDLSSASPIDMTAEKHYKLSLILVLGGFIPAMSDTSEILTKAVAQWSLRPELT